jgi:hypothetical protein
LKSQHQDYKDAFSRNGAVKLNKFQIRFIDLHMLSLSLAVFAAIAVVDIISVLKLPTEMGSDTLDS